MERQTAPHHPSSPAVDHLLQHADWLRNFARALVRDGDEAEDVAQETWMALGHAPLPEGLSVRRWLAGIAKNVVRNRRRSARRRKAHEGFARAEHAVHSSESAGRSILEDSELIERQRVLLGRIDTLPEAQRQAIIARFYDGAMPAKIAEAGGVPVSTIHSRIQRALETLRTDLDGEYGSRRGWAAFFAPLAGSRPEAIGVAGAASFSGLLLGPLLVAAALLASSIAWLALRGAGDVDTTNLGAATPARTTAPTLAAAAAQGPRAAGLEALSSKAPRALARGPRSVPLTVLDAASGDPVPGAEVIAMTEPEAKEIAAEMMDSPELFESLSAAAFMASYGETSLADDQGRAQVPAGERLLALASTDGAIGFQVIDAGSGAPTIEIERAHRLTVRVLNAAGALVETPVPVGAILKTKRPKSAFERMPYFETTIRPTRDGIVRFQNPWILTSLDGIEPGPRSAYQYSIETVYIAAPGVGEYEPSARAPGRFKPFSRLPGARERELRLPAMGALVVELMDGGGIADVDGTISIRFPGRTLGASSPESYERPIRGGKASFPMFVTGGRPFDARISLPARGATLTLQGTGPMERAETKKWRVQVPHRPAVTARFVDPSGDPISGVHVQLQHSQHAKGRTMGMTGFVASQTDETGAARFEIPKGKKMAPPFTVKAARYHRGKLQETFGHLSLAEQDLQSGKDLGELEMMFVEATPIQGVVLDDDGRPFREASVSIEAPGHFGTSFRTDAKGRFSTDCCLFGVEVLKISSNDGRFLDEFRTLANLDLTQPIEVQFSRGATFMAQIECGGIASPERMLGMRMTRTDRPMGALQDSVWIKHLGGGEFTAEAVPAGTYSVSLYLSGNLPLTTIEGVQAKAAGELRDPRIDGLRLTDYAREIEVTWEGSGGNSKRRPQMSVYGTAPDGDRKTMHFAGNDEPFVIPTGVAASAVFESAEGRFYRVDDVRTIQDSLHIVFGKPLQATLRIAGKTPKDAPEGVTWLLRGMPGTAAEGTTVYLEPSEVKNGISSVSFPAPGRYRLFRRSPDQDMGNNMFSSAAPVPTTEVIEVEAARGDEPSLISLSIAAPLFVD